MPCLFVIVKTFLKEKKLSNRILIIQTASLGDVILSAALAETLHHAFAGASIDYLVKKGYESLFTGHPFINEVLVWDKKKNKYLNMLSIIRKVRRKRYDAVINVQRFASSGLITALSGSPVRSGFSKNPFSFTFTHKSIHLISATGKSEHEIDRNHRLIGFMKEMVRLRPVLYPGKSDFAKIAPWSQGSYITISPASLWYTKQYPVHKWIQLINNIPGSIGVILLGSDADSTLCRLISDGVHRGNLKILAGELSFLQSAALMQKAVMNYVNDSAPQHMASSVNAPVTTVYCSTVPEYGFGPLSDDSMVIETGEKLECRPCGLHGWQQCPKGHFRCAESINIQQLLNRINL